MDDKQRLALQLKQFREALTAFGEALSDDDGNRKSRDSLLLRFVFTFEMAWKSLKFALIVDGLKTPDYAAAVLRAALQAQLITDAGLWETIKDMRNNISHAYDESQAIAIAAFARERAVAAFHVLLKTLETASP